MTEHIYAPWRHDYVTNIGKSDICVFCNTEDNKESEDYILVRGEYSYIIMNRYPYAPGHMLINPYKHTDSLEDIDDNTWSEINMFAKQSTKLLKSVLKAQGVNLGMNIGSAAGAGISEHLHMHVLPRWARDTNFISSISDNRVYSSDFNQIYKSLKNSTYLFY
jgi:diadenosine tetraphosphate (Ap4A) HIT family hydrolase